MARKGSVAPEVRVNFVYQPAVGNQTAECELPLKILVVGDFTLRPVDDAPERRRSIAINRENFDHVLAQHKLALRIAIKDPLAGDGAELLVDLAFDTISDFRPESIVRQVPELRALLDRRNRLTALMGPLGGDWHFVKLMRRVAADLDATDGTADAIDAVRSRIDEYLRADAAAGVRYDSLAPCLEAFIAEMANPGRRGAAVSRALIQDMISEIDLQLSAPVTAILHHANFQRLESAWRSLKFLVDRVDFEENIRLEMLDCSKEDLLNDFQDSPDVSTSVLCKCVYDEAFLHVGGTPFGLIVGNYEFGACPQDRMLLTWIASVAALAHAPFFAAAAPTMFGMDDWERLPDAMTIASLFERPEFNTWNEFRQSEEARYVGLTLPRFMLRSPYGARFAPVNSFNFEEDCAGSREKYLWGNAAMALATCAASSFAKYRWCPNMIGPQSGGAVELPHAIPPFMPEVTTDVPTTIPVEVQITERREYELSEAGFIGLTYRKESHSVCFFSASSFHSAKYFGQTPDGRRAETDHRLAAQLPYLFIVSRVAHYVKMIAREQLGAYMDCAGYERLLNNWLRRYQNDMEDPDPGALSPRPLRKASVALNDVDGRRGWWRFDLTVQPSFKYMDSAFTLHVVGKLEVPI